MPPSNNTPSLKVLITRPEKKATALALLLNQQGINCIIQPLFDYHPLADKRQSQQLLTTSDIIIFVSVAAVEFAHVSFNANNWHYQHVIAVGAATKAALSAINIENIIAPSQENSEGLLNTPLLNDNINNKTITIVRGNGGREHLATQLEKRGANVSYLESYQRVWRTFAENISEQWRYQQINCIMITSTALLDKLMQLIVTHHALNKSPQLVNYWQNQCLWLVASKRIKQHAKQLGLSNVIVSNGANETAMLEALNSLKTHDHQTL